MSEVAPHKGSGGMMAIIRSAFDKICFDSSFRHRHWQKWLPAQVWVEALLKSNLIEPCLMNSVNARNFNMAMGGRQVGGGLIERFDKTNTTGIFRVTYRHAKFYCVTGFNEQVEYPIPLDNKWKDAVIAASKDFFNIRLTRTTSLFSWQDEDNTTATTSSLSSRNKRQRISDVQEMEVEPPAVTTTQTIEEEEDVMSFSYWSSGEAHKLFGSHDGEDQNVRETLEKRITVLQTVCKELEGWRNVVHGRDRDDLCSKRDIFSLKGRSMILCFAYRLAVDNMNEWTWEQCCIEACSQLNKIGIVQATHHRTVQDWNVEFRKDSAFLHPNNIVRCGKRPQPLLFLKYPQVKQEITSFGLKNLTTLTVELVYSYCLETLFPRLYEIWREDMHHAASSVHPQPNDLGELTLQKFLIAHGMHNFSIPTCWRWLHRLGFSYNSHRKGYYVDGHERSDVVETRKVFCKNYLTELEPRCLRWVQYSETEYQTISSILLPQFAYEYFDNDQKKCYEFHIDYIYSSSASSNNNLLMDTKEFSMSVRAPPQSRPIEIYGQDESVFSQYFCPSKSWFGPNQEVGLHPKSLGEGLMISAFVSRDTGFGMPISDNDLQRINSSRNGQDYLDTTAALEVHKSIKKAALRKTPFVRELLIGASKGGYWNSFHMAIQLEDAVDCLKILRPGFVFVFLFDHSQGHARKKDQALDANAMSRSFGGVQPKMRCTMLTAGCLGPFPHTLNVGDQQSMIFEADHPGPWWLVSTELCDKRRQDYPDGRSKIVPRTRVELAKALLEGANITVESSRTLIELKEYARMHGIPVTREKIIVTEGWQGKQKGLLQVLWERGWIDTSQCKASKDKDGNTIINTSPYTLNGKRNLITGEVNELMSLRHLMAKCPDFMEEETALQFLGSQLGIEVMLTPKFHCEFAGEGIEYCWAHAKAKMRRTPIHEKKGRNNFIALVSRCLCSASVLTQERIRKFSSRARAYICTYFYLSHDLQNRNSNVNDDNGSGQPSVAGDTMGVFPAVKQQLLFTEIEQLMKKFKAHRCALDFDTSFVLAALTEDENEPET
jgi:hypothetical protein